MTAILIIFLVIKNLKNKQYFTEWCMWDYIRLLTTLLLTSIIDLVCIIYSLVKLFRLQ